ncbi:ABC transporter permease [Undibacterium sp. RTI2.1]|uniref:ABC transporter permease n=1 Tax=unclassified Undibacterium TaxID=2630295 RepID=UPI002AB33C3A|nr:MULTISPECIES: ABC transporter permease [unclassified Undibacterium]MDY7539943.1 ABC transporter permease [Undibacterium sp. 5I1]MEB0031146.1 ABC transporter permease [Undibacterium sp. RTI2.1]MEB0116454.1 ABC transporter permease [Undibacterium sp. RTI2.2]MEB0230550.1 ABC transporter permease [Undibacterium sp. 10I3]MEB0257248.1 ABC transporter permease [Undibacterium sp. 5I1]
MISTASIFHNLSSPWLSLWQHRVLLGQLCKRDLTSKYKGSMLGLIWSFLLPLMMLAIYAFVFGEVFKSRWGTAPAPTTLSEKLSFALILYVGLIVFNWLAECLSKSPTIILSNINYVKRVVFPLEVLPMIPVIVGAFHFLMSFTVFACFVLFSPLEITVYWLAMPLLLIPYLLCLAGITWFLASIGAYFRDLEQVIPALTSALMFLSPVFYSISALPEAFQSWLMMNPLTFIIEAMRNLLFWHKLPDLFSWLVLYCMSLIMFYVGYFSFNILRRGFADVL